MIVKRGLAAAVERVVVARNSLAPIGACTRPRICCAKSRFRVAQLPIGRRMLRRMSSRCLARLFARLLARISLGLFPRLLSHLARLLAHKLRPCRGSVLIFQIDRIWARRHRRGGRHSWRRRNRGGSWHRRLRPVGDRRRRRWSGRRSRHRRWGGRRRWRSRRRRILRGSARRCKPVARHKIIVNRRE